MKFLKKIAPLAVGLLFFGATVTAAGLDTLTTDFAGADIVVHAGLATSAYDILAAVDIGNALSLNTAIVDVDSAETESVLISATGDDLNYGEEIGDVDATYTEDDFEVMLADETFKESKGNTNVDTTYTQKLEFNQVSPTQDADGTGLVMFGKNTEDSLKTVSTYLKLDKSDTPLFTYKIHFDDDIQYDDTSSATMLKDLKRSKITLLGTEYTIVEVSDTGAGGVIDGLTLMSGAKAVTMREYATETHIVEGQSYEVEVVIISDSALTAKLSINGETTDALAEGDIYTLNDGTEIGVDEIMPNEGAEGAGPEGVGNDIVSFYLGVNKIEINDAWGDVKFNGKKHEDYKIESDIEYDAVTAADIENILIQVTPKDHVFLSEGDDWVEPIFGKWKLDFTELDKDTETYTADAASDDGTFTVTNNAGKEFDIELWHRDASTEVVLGHEDYYGLVETSGAAIIAGQAMAISDGDTCDGGVGGSDACEGIYFLGITSGNEAHLVEVENIDTVTNTVDLKDWTTGKDYDDQPASAGTTIDIGDLNVAILVDGTQANGDIEFDDIIEAGAAAGTFRTHKDAEIALVPDALGAGHGNACITGIVVISNSGAGDADTFEFISDGADDMQIDNIVGVTMTKEDKDSDERVGIYDDADGGEDYWGTIWTYDGKDKESLTIEYPEEQKNNAGVIAKVYIKSIVSANGETTVTGLSYDTETSFDGPVVSVGGTGINQVTATLLGLTYPTYGYEQAWIDATGVDSAGKGIIKIIESPALGTVAMIVAGWEGVETQVLGDILKEGTPALTGTEVLIDTSGKTVITV